MIRAVCSVFLVSLAVASAQNTGQLSRVSPCPDIFQYEQEGNEPGKWYGVINLKTDIVLHGLWLNVVLDEKADILGNWLGAVSTIDNMDFKVENSATKINPGTPIAFRFFVQYNPMNIVPALKAIRLNGEDICKMNSQEITLGIPETATKKNISDNKNLNSYTWPVTTAKPAKVKPIVRIDTQSKTENIKVDSVSGNVDSKLVVKKNDTRSVSNPPAKDSIFDFRTETTKNDLNKLNTVNNDIITKPDNTRNSQSSGQTDQNDFLYEKPNTQVKPSNVGSPSSIQSTIRSDDFVFVTPSNTAPINSPSGINFGDGGIHADNDYDYVGGIPTIFIPSNIERGSSSSKKIQCGKVIFNNSRVEAIGNGAVSAEGQYPWQIAMYQNQRSSENKYICGATLVTHRHVITAAHCVTRRGSQRLVNINTLTMYLGKSNLRTSIDGVQIKFVEKILIHPNYNATTLNRDIAIIQLKEAVLYTEHVLPICLWPDTLTDLSSVIGKHGSVVGWGFDDAGAAKQELSVVKMPVVDSDICLKSYSAFFAKIISEYSYCATYAEDTSVCNGDSGGGMVFKSGDTWYLRGVASLSVARQNQFRCDPNHYVIFTDVAKLLPWIKDNIFNY